MEFPLQAQLARTGRAAREPPDGSCTDRQRRGSGQRGRGPVSGGVPGQRRHQLAVLQSTTRVPAGRLVWRGHGDRLPARDVQGLGQE